MAAVVDYDDVVVVVAVAGHDAVAEVLFVRIYILLLLLLLD